MQNINAQWDTGYLIVMYLSIALVLIGWGFFWIAGIFAVRKYKYYNTVNTASYDRDFPLASCFSVGGALIAVIFMIVGAINAWPFSGQYHRWQPMQGVVKQVGQRVLASGVKNGGSYQKIVVSFVNPNTPTIGLDETRAALIQPGDTVQALCIRSYQFNAPNEGWDCNLVTIVRDGKRVA